MNLNFPEYKIVRDMQKCILCGACARQCSNEAHLFDPATKKISEVDKNCVNCARCVHICPTGALHIIPHPHATRPNANWTKAAINEINIQANTGSVLLGGMGNPKENIIYWDKMLLNASQVTNPSLDPLREPMETVTYLGAKAAKPVFRNNKIESVLPTNIKLKVPIMFAAMSFGSISLNAQKCLAAAAKECGIMFNTGEGGLHQDLYEYKDNTIVQVASGRFGVHKKYLEAGAMIEIKIGQGAKPGIGGHLPGEKVNDEVSRTRMIPEGTDAISPAPHHDIYSIEDLRQLIYSLKEVTEYKKPVAVKIAAVHNSAAIASGIARAGADVIVIDGYRGGTGATPVRTRDNVGIPIELALAAIDQRLRDEGIRNTVSLVASGTIRNSADIVKAIALGADAVYIGTAALIALGCQLCGKCYTGKCNWGIATQRPELTSRLNVANGTKRLVNLIHAWEHEIRDLLGGMGINAIESLRGNRLMLRGVGLNQKELDILGINYAGE